VKKHKRVIFLGISLMAIVLMFLCAYKQDYARTTELYSMGLRPSFMFHYLALVFGAIGCISWCAFTLTFFKTTIRSSWKQLWKDLHLSFLK